MKCGLCGHILTMHDGIPDLAEHLLLDDPGLSPSQKVMNSRFFASIYESPIWRPLHTLIGSGISMEKEVKEVLEMSGTSPINFMADLACGTGHYARAFARMSPEAHIYGMDISPSMLTQGRKLARRQGLTTIMFLRGDINSLPFDDNSLDRVNCGGALHLFNDLATIWQEISRVLKPGGVFTAMTLSITCGTIRRLQQWLVDHGRATFFHPHQLATSLRTVGFSSFKHMQHGVSLLFCAVKDTHATKVKGT